MASHQPVSASRTGNISVGRPSSWRILTLWSVSPIESAMAGSHLGINGRVGGCGSHCLSGDTAWRGLVSRRRATICADKRVTSSQSIGREKLDRRLRSMEQMGPSGNQSRMWSDEALGTTEYLFADYRDFAFPAHVHETFGIGVIEAGGQQFRPGRAASLIMPADTLCVFNPGLVHEGRPATERGWRYRMFYPSPTLVARALEEAQDRPVYGEWGFVGHVIDDPELYREFELLHVSSQLRETLLERETRIAAFLRRLFKRHGNFSPERTRARIAPHTVGIVRDYLHANAELPVSIADLAQAAGVSGTQVIRAFSAETGMPPHSYLLSLRVERAKRLLRAGTSLAATAIDVGFYDQSQLTRHFKRLTGVTPGRFAAEASPARAR
jgi:AraC-like DNA-binding protein